MFTFFAPRLVGITKDILTYLSVLQQPSCLLINPITVSNFADLFNGMPVDRVSDLIITATLSYLF